MEPLKTLEKEIGVKRTQLYQIKKWLLEKVKTKHFSLSITECLEHSIISNINPEWNIQGKTKKESIKHGEESLHSIEELDKIHNLINQQREVMKYRGDGLSHEEILSNMKLTEDEYISLQDEYHEFTGK